MVSKFLSNLPPFRTRARVWNPRKTENPTVVKEFCLLPIFGGVWIPYRDITKQMYKLEAAAKAAIAHAKYVKAAYEQSCIDANSEINKVGFHAENIVKLVDGDRVIISTDELVSIKITPSKGVVVEDKKPVVKKESFRPPIQTVRPRQNNGNSNGGNKNNNGQK